MFPGNDSFLSSFLSRITYVECIPDTVLCIRNTIMKLFRKLEGLESDCSQVSVSKVRNGEIRKVGRTNLNFLDLLRLFL